MGEDLEALEVVSEVLVAASEDSEVPEMVLEALMVDLEDMGDLQDQVSKRKTRRKANNEKVFYEVFSSTNIPESATTMDAILFSIINHEDLVENFGIFARCDIVEEREREKMSSQFIFVNISSFIS